jgi:hypothetical protein
MINKRWIRLGLLWVAAFLLAGCQLHAAVDVRLDRDGGGVVTLTVETDEALDEQARAAGFDLAGSLALEVDALDGWDARAEGRRVEMTTEADGPRELERLTATLADALEGPELRPLEGFRVTATQDRLRVEGAAGLQPTGAVGDLGFDVAEAERELSRSVRYTVSVHLPGEITTHDADRRDGNRLEWDVAAGQQVDITVETALPPDRPWLLPAVVAAALALLVTVVLVRRRSSHD